jgi:putative nucleotidyltransferase with HDIG domain
MKEILLKDVEAGMVTGAPVKTKSGQTLADANTTLSNKLIARFTFYHVQSVVIEDTIEGKTAEPTVKVENKVKSYTKKVKESSFSRDHVSFNQKISLTDEFREFQLSYALCLEDLKRNFERIKRGEFEVGREPLLMHAAGISKYRTALELFNMIRCVRFSEDSIYSHCLNVALEVCVLGRWLKLDNQTLNELTNAALLHDIGKTEVNTAVLNKKGKLTPEEFEEIKKHTIIGNSILKNAGFGISIRNAALQHHERNDGSGYPRNLTGDEIDDFASMIALIDVYDAMTSPRPQRAPLCSFEVIEEFEKIGLEKYNTKYLLTFLTHLAGMHHNTMVMLDDGTSGRVVYINQSKLSRPIIEKEDGEVVDLSREPNRRIIRTL